MKVLRLIQSWCIFYPLQIIIPILNKLIKRKENKDPPDKIQVIFLELITEGGDVSDVSVSKIHNF